jgi:excisionase family DNA binding protein
MEPYITIREAAKLTGFAVGTLRKYVLRREMPYHKVMGAIRFRCSELEPWMASGGKKRVSGPGDGGEGVPESGGETGQIALPLGEKA